MFLNNNKYVSALNYLCNNKNVNVDDFRNEFPFVADDIITELKKRKAITILTNDIIWILDEKEVCYLIQLHNNQDSISYTVRKNWKVYLEVAVSIITILTFLITCVG